MDGEDGVWGGSLTVDDVGWSAGGQGRRKDEGEIKGD